MKEELKTAAERKEKRKKGKTTTKRKDTDLQKRSIKEDVTICRDKIFFYSMNLTSFYINICIVKHIVTSVNVQKN